MDVNIFFGHSNVLIISTLFLIAFTSMGVFDGLYFHVLKFKLHRVKDAAFEHKIHAARGVLLGPIIAIIFAINSGGYLLWCGIFCLILDTLLEFFDIREEKNARKNIGGVPTEETILHIMATSARVAAIALILGNKSANDYLLSAPALLSQSYPPFLQITGTLVAVGAFCGAFFQMVTMFAAYLVKSNNGTGLSNEGLSFQDYNIFVIYFCMPFTLLFECILKILRPTLKETVVGNKTLPNNAILYSFHKDALLTLSTKAFISIPHVAYIGYHGFASYIPTFYFNSLGIKAIRYRRNQAEKPKDIIIREMKNWNGPIAIRTDSGKPYGEVRASLIDLSKATGRPLVPMVQKADKYIMIAAHIVPLPGAHVTTIFGEPISDLEIKTQPREEARALLQKRILQLNY